MTTALMLLRKTKNRSRQSPRVPSVFSSHSVRGVPCTSSWRRHQMETFVALLALCAENSPVPVISPHKDQWRGALIFSWICAWINDWVNNRKAGDLRRHRGHYDIDVMCTSMLNVYCVSFILKILNDAITWLYMSQVTKLRLSCYLVLLSVDSKTR